MDHQRAFAAHRWNAYLNETRGLVKSDRLKEMRGAGYTAAMRSAILVVARRIPESVLADLDAARGNATNGFTKRRR
jgi:hypothetical protein